MQARQRNAQRNTPRTVPQHAANGSASLAPPAAAAIAAAVLDQEDSPAQRAHLNGRMDSGQPPAVQPSLKAETWEARTDATPGKQCSNADVSQQQADGAHAHSNGDAKRNTGGAAALPSLHFDLLQPADGPTGQADSAGGFYDSAREADLEQLLGQLVGTAELIKGDSRTLTT